MFTNCIHFIFPTFLRKSRATTFTLTVTEVCSWAGSSAEKMLRSALAVFVTLFSLSESKQKDFYTFKVVNSRGKLVSLEKYRGSVSPNEINKTNRTSSCAEPGWNIFNFAGPFRSFCMPAWAHLLRECFNFLSADGTNTCLTAVWGARAPLGSLRGRRPAAVGALQLPWTTSEGTTIQAVHKRNISLMH